MRAHTRQVVSIKLRTLVRAREHRTENGHDRQNIGRDMAAPCPIFLSSGRSDTDRPFYITNVRVSETCDSPTSGVISVLRIKLYLPYTHIRKLVLKKPDILLAPEFGI